MANPYTTSYSYTDANGDVCTVVSRNPNINNAGPKAQLVNDEAYVKPRFDDAPYLGYHTAFNNLNNFDPYKTQPNQQESAVIQQANAASYQQQQPMQYVNGQWVPIGMPQQQPTNMWGYPVQTMPTGAQQQTPFSNPYGGGVLNNGGQHWPTNIGGGMGTLVSNVNNGADIFSGQFRPMPGEVKFDPEKDFYLDADDLANPYVQDCLRRSKEEGVNVQEIIENDEFNRKLMLGLQLRAGGMSKEEAQEFLDSIEYQLPHVRIKRAHEQWKKDIEKEKENMKPFYVSIGKRQEDGTWKWTERECWPDQRNSSHKLPVGTGQIIDSYFAVQQEKKNRQIELNNRLYDEAPERMADNCTLLEYFNEYAGKIQEVYNERLLTKLRNERTGKIFQYRTLNNLLAKAGVKGYSYDDTLNDIESSPIINGLTLKDFIEASEETRRKYLSILADKMKRENPTVGKAMNVDGDGRLSFDNPGLIGGSQGKGGVNSQQPDHYNNEEDEFPIDSLNIDVENGGHLTAPGDNIAIGSDFVMLGPDAGMMYARSKTAQETEPKFSGYNFVAATIENDKENFNMKKESLKAERHYNGGIRDS